MSEARVIKPDRLQARWDMFDLEALLPTDHRARLVWGFVESLNLEEFYAAVGFAGRLGGSSGRRSGGAFVGPCGFTRRSRGSVRRGSWTGLPNAISRIAGWLAACR